MLYVPTSCFHLERERLISTAIVVFPGANYLKI